MERRIFVNKIVRWGAVIILAGITLLLGRKISTVKNCSSCPEYAACPGIDSCTTELANR
ncbi:MAG TPA: hypothetical protein VMW76_07705 [Bacteroidales bacterium]|nr:hypothetical protein [Bacteroidales bacterium]